MGSRIRTVGLLCAFLVAGVVGTAPGAPTIRDVCLDNSCSCAHDPASTLVWNETDRRLGVGNSTPSYPLDVYITSGSVARFYSGGTTTAEVRIQTSSTADPYISMLGYDTWSVGVDSSDVGRFKIHDDSSLADSSQFELGPSGDVYILGRLRPAAGTAALPAHSFSSDVDTGIYGDGLDALLFSTGGSERARIDSSGNVGIGTNSPSARLDVSGDARVGGVLSGCATFVEKTSDESVTSSTTLQDDDELSFTVGAGETWIFEMAVFHTSASSTPDIKLALNGPASPTNFIYELFNMPKTAYDDAMSASILAGWLRFGKFRGSIENGANAGSLVLRWAQDTSDATATTVKQGSYLKAFRVN